MEISTAKETPDLHWNVGKEALEQTPLVKGEGLRNVLILDRNNKQKLLQMSFKGPNLPQTGS